jgi:uncharacterized protein YkwD
MRAIVGGSRRTSASLLAACMAFAMLAIAAPAHAEACAFADAQPGEASQADLSQATLCLLNEERAAAGLAPLRASAPLATTAQRYAEYMVSDAHFAHQDESGHNVVYRVLETDPSLADRWLVIGENLGWGTYTLATPRAMVDGWMNSPTHRDNILYPTYDEVGVGISSGAPVAGGRDGALTYTTVFGKLDPEADKPDTADDEAKVSRHTRPAVCRKAKRARTRKARRRAKRQCAAKLRRMRASRAHKS